MPPLNRQESRASIYSWWSDSNSLLLHGPTINLHAAAKPLMRLMYHRQALDIIRKNRGSPLTRTILETYASYFPWDYVSWATKAVILSELADRTVSSEVEARAVVNSPVCSHIAQMLGSPDPRARICSCQLLRNLAWFKSTAPAVLELKLCEQLVFLLDDNNSGVICVATNTLSQITQWVDGVKGVVDAKALDHVLRLLESPNLDTREWACVLTRNVALHKSTAPAILNLNPSVQFVSLLGGEYHRQALDIIRKNYGNPLTTVILETYVSYFRWDYVSWASTKAAILSELADRTVSSEVEAANLARFESTAPAVLELKLCEQLVFLLDDNDYSGVICEATYTLARLSRWVDGAKDVVDAKALDHVLRLLESPKSITREWACYLTGNLASHEATAPTILQLKPIPQLESLLQDPHPRIRDKAISALEAIRQWPDGVDVAAPTDSDGALRA
ncbi:armadillo-type protein [Mycena olivaceomarginata]|nr:armadillo-type protein [Mycena olivaceomarginata]